MMPRSTASAGSDARRMMANNRVGEGLRKYDTMDAPELHQQ
jgi:hypothetical protein